jgi:hypothetical protein
MPIESIAIALPVCASPIATFDAMIAALFNGGERQALT